MKINNKGFTMVELLVSMAIMGLLVIMAFPTIRAIQTNNTNKKYEEYGKSAKSAAKLYIDSYGVDIFDPSKTSQKIDLGFDELVKKDLLKDINISDSTCITGRSNVWILKYNDDYTYCLQMVCKLKGTDDSSEPLYESTDDTSNCKGIAEKLKTVTYRYDDGTKINEFKDAIIEGDDNYRIVALSKTGFNFNANHDVFLKWVDENGKEYDANKIYDKIATESTVFTAKTRKWEYYIYFNRNSDGTYGGSMSSPQTCSYGSTCKLTPNGYTREAYTFKHWKNGKTNDTYTNGEDVKTKIGDKITHDRETIHLTGIFRPNICSVKYNANGGTLQSAHGSTISQSGNKIIVSNNEVHHKIEYGDKLSSSGLNDWNNPTYINLLRTGFHIDAGQEWNTKSDGTGTPLNQTSQYAGTTLCQDLKNGDKEVTVYANWKKNSCTITYNANGGKFNAHATELTQSFSYGSNIGDTSGMRKASSGYYNATKTDYIITPGAAWTSGSKTFDEKTNYKIEQICSMANANGTVTLKVNWKKNDNNDISCACGYYLKANATTCSQCEAGYYCPGGIWKKKNDIQGRYNCPSGYGNSPKGSCASTQCYMNVPAGKYVKNKKDASPSICAANYYRVAHTVNYNSNSVCNKCPTAYPKTTSQGSVAITKCYREVPAGYYFKGKTATKNTACDKGTYKAKHNVYYDSSSSCTNCPAGYRDGSGTTKIGNCINKVNKNYYVKTKNKLEVSCPTSYVSNAHDVKYGETSSCTFKELTFTIEFIYQHGEDLWNNNGITSKKASCKTTKSSPSKCTIEASKVPAMDNLPCPSGSDDLYKNKCNNCFNVLFTVNGWNSKQDGTGTKFNRTNVTGSATYYSTLTPKSQYLTSRRFQIKAESQCIGGDDINAILRTRTSNAVWGYAPGFNSGGYAYSGGAGEEGYYFTWNGEYVFERSSVKLGSQSMYGFHMKGNATRCVGGRNGATYSGLTCPSGNYYVRGGQLIW